MCNIFFWVYFAIGNKRDWFISWIPLRIIYAAIVMIFFVPCGVYLFIVMWFLYVPFGVNELVKKYFNGKYCFYLPIFFFEAFLVIKPPNDDDDDI